MRFSPRLKRNLITSGFLIALASPLLGLQHAEAQESLPPTNPLRQIIIDTDQVWGSVPNSYPNESDVFSGAEPSSRGVGLSAGSELRPTKGRFCQQGERWFFVPEFPEFAEIVLPRGKLARRPINVFRISSRENNWTNSLDELKLDAISEPENPLRREQDQQLVSKRDDHRTILNMPDEIAVEDNLMMQRVVTKMTDRGRSRKWIVSGEIVKESGRYKLLLHSASPIPADVH